MSLTAAGAARRAGWLLPGLFLFILALELLKKGAAAVGPLLRGLDITGVPGALGFGWVMSCVVLSGSPVAAIALALLAARTLSTEEAFGMIGGSRLGASFVVLVIGMLDDLRTHRTEKRSAYSAGGIASGRRRSRSATIRAAGVTRVARHGRTVFTSRCQAAS